MGFDEARLTLGRSLEGEYVDENATNSTPSPGVLSTDFTGFTVRNLGVGTVVFLKGEDIPTEPGVGLE